MQVNKKIELEDIKRNLRPKIKGMAFHPPGFLLVNSEFLLSFSCFGSFSAIELEEMPLLQHRTDQQEEGAESLFPLSFAPNIFSQIISIALLYA